MNDLRVSVVIVNFNYEVFLAQAIDSALAQITPAGEVVVVVECSTDNSVAVMRRYGDRIVAVPRRINGGMSAAVNSGYERVTGNIVMIVDADDFLYPDAVARVTAAWDDDVAQVQARLDLVDANGTVGDVFPPYEVRLDSGDVTSLLGRRGRYATTVTTGLAFARRALDAVMPIPERQFDRSADGYLATVIPLYGRVVSIDARIGGYRRHEANHSGFQANIAKRGRWCVDHDEQRYAALRTHAAPNHIPVAATPGMNDATHIEQRLASLCFDRAQHPYHNDSRVKLGHRGARAAMDSTMSFKRRAMHAGMFLVAGWAPLPIARRALAWKLERSSRPKAIDWVAGHLRRLMG